MPSKRDNDGKLPDCRTGLGRSTPTRLLMRIAGSEMSWMHPCHRRRRGLGPVAHFRGIAHPPQGE